MGAGYDGRMTVTMRRHRRTSRARARGPVRGRASCRETGLIILLQHVDRYRMNGGETVFPWMRTGGGPEGDAAIAPVGAAGPEAGA